MDEYKRRRKRRSRYYTGEDRKRCLKQTQSWRLIVVSGLFFRQLFQKQIANHHLLLKRFFHLEFFRLTKAVKGVGKKNDLVALETNMRPPGGYTPDLINFSQSVNSYQIYGDVMAFNENRQDLSMKKYFAACASRRDFVWYKHSDQEVFDKYYGKLCNYGHYPYVLSGAMGDRFFMVKLDTLEEVAEFKEFTEARK